MCVCRIATEFYYEPSDKVAFDELREKCNCEEDLTLEEEDKYEEVF